MSVEEHPLGKPVVIHGKLSSIAADHSAMAFGFWDQNTNDISYHLPSELAVQRFVTGFQQAATIKWIERPQYNSVGLWQGFLMLVVFILLVFSRFTYPRRFNQLMQASMSNNALFQLLREWNPLRNILSYLFIISYAMLLSLILFHLLMQMQLAEIFFEGEWQNFITVFGIVFFVVFGKNVSILFISWLFRHLSAGRRYISNQIVFSFLNTLFLLPFVLVMIFSPTIRALITTLVIISILQIFRFVRSLRVGLAEGDLHLFYLFLYLCALEIVPLLLLTQAVLLISNGQTIG